MVATSEPDAHCSRYHIQPSQHARPCMQPPRRVSRSWMHAFHGSVARKNDSPENVRFASHARSFARSVSDAGESVTDRALRLASSGSLPGGDRGGQRYGRDLWKRTLLFCLPAAMAVSQRRNALCSFLLVASFTRSESMRISRRCARNRQTSFRSIGARQTSAEARSSPRSSAVMCAVAETTQPALDIAWPREFNRPHDW